MDKVSEICEEVKKMCKNLGVDFLFITDGRSCWSVESNEHIKKVAKFHKETEKFCD